MQHETESAEESFGAMVNAVRMIREMSQREFAAKLTERGMPVDASAVSRIEKGSRSVRLTEAITIADVLGVDLDSLIADSRTPAQEFRRLRDKTDLALARLREPMSHVVFLLDYTSAFLHEHPELLATLEDKKRGAPKSPEAYLPWVASRLGEWQIPDEDYTATDHEANVEAIADVIGKYAAKLIGPLREDTGVRNGEHQEA